MVPSYLICWHNPYYIHLALTLPSQLKSNCDQQFFWNKFVLDLYLVSFILSFQGQAGSEFPAKNPYSLSSHHSSHFSGRYHWNIIFFHNLQLLLVTSLPSQPKLCSNSTKKYLALLSSVGETIRGGSLVKSCSLGIIRQSFVFCPLRQNPRHLSTPYDVTAFSHPNSSTGPRTFCKI